MSYLRYGSVFKYVDGISGNYIFHSSSVGKHPEYIEDYGRISNEALVELFAEYFKGNSELFRDYMIKQLAKKLNVKLRKKPLSDREAFERTIKNHNEWVKENKDWLDKIGGKSRVIRHKQ